METTQFIDQLAAGKAAEASTTLNDLLSAKAFEALENRKIEIARTAFGGGEQSDGGNIEVQDTADTPVEQN